MALAGVQGGAPIEAMKRLRKAVEDQSRASGRLTKWIIVLMVVQILVGIEQIVVAIVKVGR